MCQTLGHTKTVHIPITRVRESLGILLDERNRFQSVGHLHKMGGHRVPFLRPLDLCNGDAIGKRLAIAGKYPLYPATSKMTSSSTGAPSGRLATPYTKRQGALFSPKTFCS